MRYGSLARAGFCLAGFQVGRILTPRTAATNSREKDADGSNPWLNLDTAL